MGWFAVVLLDHSSYYYATIQTQYLLFFESHRQDHSTICRIYSEANNMQFDYI